ncbi:hypothetical protein GCM10023172_29200 [Hymenobacter ginsengisoli]|uniref:DUF5723 domain-containing protein n=1 Tax=Hymenobacter ginsengisoli TaxID=1051626 RepID=A0ABP8QIP0_9BACT|nr:MULTISPECIES: DUF5723 family protein [unclassified Hymenobacter]MBO2029824.1 hypothetical protein [Hymenobacter sp. BT559]
MKTTSTPCRGWAAACLLPSLWLLAASPAAAQGWLGLAQSNYGGTNSAYVNPSAIADSRLSAYLNLGGANLNFYNTYLQLNLPQKPWSAGFSLSKDNLTEQGGAGLQYASATAEVRLPSLLLTLGPRSAVAFSSRVRGFAQASGVSYSLARLARYGLGQASQLGLANQLLTDNSFNLEASAYHEFAFTYARTFTPNTTHFFKGGLTLKYLVGLGGGYVRNEGTQFKVLDKNTLEVQSRQLSYGLTDYKLYGENGFSLGSLYGDQQLGRGYGADLGLTYEWRPDYEAYDYEMDGQRRPDDSRNKYRLRLGLALTDIGAIGYNNNQRVRQGQVASSGTVRLGQLDTLKFSTLQSVENTLQRTVGLSSTARSFTTYLPAALRLTADYRLAGHLYAGLLWVQSVLPPSTVGARTPSLLALTPRVEFSKVELAVPVLLANGYRQLQVGAMLRLGPLVVGSDNLGGLLGIESATGADVYFGLALALRRHRRRDRDGDGVSNAYDKCPKEKGTWATRGCAPPLAPTPAAPVETAPPAPAAPTEVAPPAAPAPAGPPAAPETTSPATPAEALPPATPAPPAETPPASPAPAPH